MLRQISLFFNMIKFEHTVFALPFAYLGMVLAAGGWPSWWQFFWISVAMVAARTAAMAANRLIDRDLDARNPRTAGRALPQKRISPIKIAGAIVVSVAVLIIAAWQLNPLALALSPLAVLFLIGYSYTKRFTCLSHFILGFTDGIAPVGAWIAVRGRFDPPVFVLWFAVTVWIAGFDLIYACQDAGFDRAEGVHAIPALFGIATTLRLAQACHVLTALSLAVLGLEMGLGIVYWIGWLIVVGLLIYEHSLVRPDDLSRVDVAFFTVNGYISVIAFVATLVALYVSTE